MEKVTQPMVLGFSSWSLKFPRARAGGPMCFLSGCFYSIKSAPFRVTLCVMPCVYQPPSPCDIQCPSEKSLRKSRQRELLFLRRPLRRPGGCTRVLPAVCSCSRCWSLRAELTEADRGRRRASPVPAPCTGVQTLCTWKRRRD